MLRRPPQPASRRPRADRTADLDRAATTIVNDRQAEAERPGRDPGRPVYVISVAAGLVAVHPRTLRIYEGEGLICPARTPSNIRLYSENDIRRVLWIRHLTQNLGVNLAGVRVLFELEERLGMRILEQLYSEGPITRTASGEEPDTAGTPR
jgi:MerR family transcriptional regulator/heat shock protein HspR